MCNTLYRGPVTCSPARDAGSSAPPIFSPFNDSHHLILLVARGALLIRVHDISLIPEGSDLKLHNFYSGIRKDEKL